MRRRLGSWKPTRHSCAPWRGAIPPTFCRMSGRIARNTLSSFRSSFCNISLVRRGSFESCRSWLAPSHECVARQINPAEMVHIADFIQAIREVASACNEPICYIVGGDLAHVGMKFGDEGPLTQVFLDQVAQDDQALLAAAGSNRCGSLLPGHRRASRSAAHLRFSANLPVTQYDTCNG